MDLFPIKLNSTGPLAFRALVAVAGLALNLALDVVVFAAIGYGLQRGWNW